MTLFCTSFTYTATTWQRMITAPEDRSAAVAAAFEAVGGRLVAMYYVLGPHDGMVIVDVPDEVGMAAVSALVSASGAYAHVETQTLLTPQDMVEALGRSGAVQARFTPPGGAGERS